MDRQLEDAAKKNGRVVRLVEKFFPVVITAAKILVIQVLTKSIQQLYVH